GGRCRVDLQRRPAGRRSAVRRPADRAALGHHRPARRGGPQAGLDGQRPGEGVRLGGGVSGDLDLPAEGVIAMRNGSGMLLPMLLAGALLVAGWAPGAPAVGGQPPPARPQPKTGGTENDPLIQLELPPLAPEGGAEAVLAALNELPWASR